MSAAAEALLDTVRAMTDTERLELAELLELERPAPELLTAAQAGARLGLHERTVVRMAREGRIPAQKAGKSWRFHADRLAVAPRKPRRVPDAPAPAPHARRPGNGRRMRDSGQRPTLRALAGR